MASKKMVQMKQGQEETSYARNSGIQNVLQNRMKLPIEAAIVDICSNIDTLLPEKILIADLGCSSGPNALALVSIAVEAIDNHCVHLKQPPPEVCVLLNDLPGNDFNAVAENLVTLRRNNKVVALTVGITPGSFYERLFTSGSLHLVCSSNSLHWLSKAPEDLTRNRIPAYDVDEHARRERLPMVLEAYAHQFRKDFTLFLELRARELVPGGRMVVSFMGRRSGDRSLKFSHMWEITAQLLSVMASEGMIDKAKYDSFYVPGYGPSDEEVREIIEAEGSFSITEMQVHDLTWIPDDAPITTSWYTNQLRAVFEPIVVQHFGQVMNEFVRTAERRWSVEGSLQDEFTRHSPQAQFVVSLTKKAC